MLTLALCLRPIRSLRTCIPPPRTRSFVFTNISRFPRATRPVIPIDKKVPPEPVPSFEEQIARTTQFKSFSEEVKRPGILNQALFFIFGSSIVYGMAASETNWETKMWLKSFQFLNYNGDILDSMGMGPPSSDELRRTKYIMLAKALQKYASDLKDATESLPLAIKNLIMVTYVNVAQRYLDSTDGRRMCWKICAVNGLIWLAWKLPSLQRRMATSFMHHPRSGLSYTLLTSMFSHKGIMHLMFNCMALSGFGSAAAHFMTKEQGGNPTGLREISPEWHFLAFYISAGLFSGLVSHIASATIRYPRLLSQIMSAETAAATTVVKSAAAKTAAPKAVDILPSLGASGAVYAAVSLTALAFPDTEIALIFLPATSIPIQYGVGGMVLLDMIGVLRGWRYLDHWAHLGGAAFGAFYYAYGPQLWDHMRLFQNTDQLQVEENPT